MQQITKSLLCRAGVTVAIVGAALVLGWYLIMVLPSRVPDLPWTDIVTYILTALATGVLCASVWLMWKADEFCAVVAGVLIGVLFWAVAWFSKDPGILTNCIMFASIVVLVEIALLVVYEHISKKVCKRILGGNHD